MERCLGATFLRLNEAACAGALPSEPINRTLVQASLHYCAEGGREGRAEWDGNGQIQNASKSVHD